MDVAGYNQNAGDGETERGNRWTVPVGPEVTMRDLSAFAVGAFDFVFHPVSNLFMPEVRVLRRGGTRLAGFLNPAVYTFDPDLADQTGELRVKHELPYASVTSLGEEELRAQIERGEPFEVRHTLEDQIGGQADAGFVISDLYEDRHRDDSVEAYMPTLDATQATKP